MRSSLLGRSWMVLISISRKEVTSITQTLCARCAAPQCPFPDKWMGSQIQGYALKGKEKKEFLVINLSTKLKT